MYSRLLFITNYCVVLTCVTTYLTYLDLFLLDGVQLAAYARLCHWLIRPFLMIYTSLFIRPYFNSFPGMALYGGPPKRGPILGKS